MTERAQRLSRRHFLLAVGAGSAATAAAIVAKKGPPQLIAGRGKPASRGYHASQHIDNYYRTAKV